MRHGEVGRERVWKAAILVKVGNATLVVSIDIVLHVDQKRLVKCGAAPRS